MNLAKHQTFFDPAKNLNDPIHIIGCGAIGSILAEGLTRLGITGLHLYDFDIVEEHNLTNQLFTHPDLYKLKVTALAEHLQAINPEAKPKLYEDGWKPGVLLKGFVFLCVDSIELRKTIVTENIINAAVKAFFDFRMRLTDAQHFACVNNPAATKVLLKSMDFTDEEAKKETPVSACNTTLSVSPTVRTIVSLGIANFINALLEKELKKCILIDAFSFSLDAF